MTQRRAGGCKSADWPSQLPRQCAHAGLQMILESFFLIVLIDAHNIEATGHRMRLHDILIRRLQLLVIATRLDRCAAGRWARACSRPCRGHVQARPRESVTLAGWQCTAGRGASSVRACACPPPPGRLASQPHVLGHC